MTTSRADGSCRRAGPIGVVLVALSGIGADVAAAPVPVSRLSERSFDVRLSCPVPGPTVPATQRRLLGTVDLEMPPEVDAPAPGEVADAGPDNPEVSGPLFMTTLPESPAVPAAYSQMFLRAWLPMTATEFALLGVTAMLPKDWTGWSSNFVSDGAHNFARAYTAPPVWDTDRWYHNYVGHPYGGSLYYNSVRSQGASVGQSVFFSFVLSMQWEYVFEAVAERPSIQDMVITPVVGSLVGEATHRMTLSFKENGLSFPEKIIVTLLNPMHVVFEGYE